LVAFDLPGTTRDAISVPFERAGQKFELIDTAGLRRKGKVFEAIEKFSVVKTLQAIESANVVLLLLDATQGVTDQDAHIAGYILESGRAVVLAVNKWDAVDEYEREQLQRQIETRLAFLKFAPMHFISAIDRPGAQVGHGEDAHAGAHPAIARGGAIPVTQARRHVPTQVALCPSGRNESPGYRGARQFPRACDRRLQTFPRRAFPPGIQVGGNAAAHRDEDFAQPVRQQGIAESVCPLVQAS
jgi:small GTP-binding protein